MDEVNAICKFFGTKSVPKACPDNLRFACDAYAAAIEGKMAVSPSEYGFEVCGELYHFTDTPINRGMLAVSESLDHIEHKEKMVTMLRLMEFIGLSKGQRKRLHHWIRMDGDELLVADALIKAFATADFNSKGSIKISSLMEVAKRLEEEEEG